MTSAVDREVAWLTGPASTGLPALLTSAGGPWDVVQAYQTRTPAVRKTALYVRRRSLTDRRFTNHRRLLTHGFVVEAWWPVGATTTAAQLWETEQRAFDDAVELLIDRITGGLDHSHGGAFLSAAEDQAGVSAQFDDPRVTLAGQSPCLRADITYSADDHEVVA